MIIDLTQISDNEKDFSFTTQPDLEDDVARLNEPVKVEGKLKKGLAQVDVQGNIKGKIEIECTRCLSPVETDLNIPFKVAYVSEEYYTQAKETEIRNDDLEVAVHTDEQIDVADLVREQILLNLPTQNFCREDCKGLCPTCGANKNTAACNCENKEIDPRWQGLRDLKLNNK